MRGLQGVYFDRLAVCLDLGLRFVRAYFRQVYKGVNVKGVWGLYV